MARSDRTAGVVCGDPITAQHVTMVATRRTNARDPPPRSAETVMGSSTDGAIAYPTTQPFAPALGAPVGTHNPDPLFPGSSDGEEIEGGEDAKERGLNALNQMYEGL